MRFSADRNDQEALKWQLGVTASASLTAAEVLKAMDYRERWKKLSF
jgi:hypothetical protein